MSLQNTSETTRIECIQERQAIMQFLDSLAQKGRWKQAEAFVIFSDNTDSLRSRLQKMFLATQATQETPDMQSGTGEEEHRRQKQAQKIVSAPLPLETCLRILSERERTILKIFLQNHDSNIQREDLEQKLNIKLSTLRVALWRLGRFAKATTLGSIHSRYGSGTYRLQTSADASYQPFSDPVSTATKIAKALLNAKEQAALHHLSSHANEVVTQEDLARVMGGTSPAVRTAITSVRSLIEACGVELGVLHTLKNQGYCLTTCSPLPLEDIRKLEWLEKELAEIFAEHPEDVLQKTWLMSQLWPGRKISLSLEHMLQNAVNGIRRKLPDRRILTVKDIGYLASMAEAIPPEVFDQLSYDAYVLLRILMQKEGTWYCGADIGHSLQKARKTIGYRDKSTHVFGATVHTAQEACANAHWKCIEVERRTKRIERLRITQGTT